MENGQRNLGLRAEFSKWTLKSPAALCLPAHRASHMPPALSR
jgi:hypothetical protein